MLAAPAAEPVAAPAVPVLLVPVVDWSGAVELMLEADVLVLLPHLSDTIDTLSTLTVLLLASCEPLI